MQAKIHTWSEMSARQQAGILRRPVLDAHESIREDVLAIIDAVRQRGDAALREYTRQFDRAELQTFEVSSEEFREAENSLTQDQITAIDVAIGTIRCFHEQQRPASIDIETLEGVRCQRISRPIDSVGLYVPAGSAPLPSTAMMLAIPAAIAGCPERILCTPCQPDGTADAAVLTAAARAGISRIFKLGGAQAIAAMAYGSESVPRVEKLFGPGNAWVTAAKTLVAANPEGVAIDLPAGPSEVLIIADATANAEFVASDLLSQAEHGPDSQVLLVCTDETLANRVISAIERQLQHLKRRAITETALGHARIIVVATVDVAIDISNQYAPEHLILQTAKARSLLPQIRNAGSVFLGPWSPESVGDYCSGTNHVLPTHGAASRYSGLGVEQFMRHMTVQELSRDGLARLAPTVIELASLEGLGAHANAVRCRLDTVRADT